jgi:hypothetical protein
VSAFDRKMRRHTNFVTLIIALLIAVGTGAAVEEENKFEIPKTLRNRLS